LALALGDVSGKGLGPAVVMATLHAVVHTRLPQMVGDLAGFVEELNVYLLANTPEDVFVTLFLAILDVSTGRLISVNAGHPAPVVLTPRCKQPGRLDKGGTVLGILPGAAYEEEQSLLEHGSLLTVFSDGLTEATNGNGNPFGEQRTLNVLRAAGDASADDVLTQLLLSVRRFARGTEQADDLSLLLVRR
jgi:sigma-B regulation protein RsbU (phosphoserine phosphatase)